MEIRIKTSTILAAVIMIATIVGVAVVVPTANTQPERARL